MRVAAKEARWIWDIVPFLFLPVAALSAITMPVNENDTFIHILMGRDILSEQRLTGNPDWTYGPYDADWVTFVHWPSQVIMALGFDAFGYGFFAALQVVLVSFFILAMYLVVKGMKAGARDEIWPSRVAAAVAILSVITITPLMGPRANTVGAVFAVFLGLWFTRVVFTGSFGRHWWLAPVVVWIWVILHGNALLAAPVLGLGVVFWWASQNALFDRACLAQCAKLLVVVGATGLVPLLTPLGPLVWKKSLVVRERTSGWIFEWTPLRLDSPESIVVILVSTLALSLCIIWARRGLGVRRALILSLGVLLLSVAIFYQQRNYLVLMPVLIVFVAAIVLNMVKEGSPRTWEYLELPLSARKVPVVGLLAAYFTTAAIFASVAGIRAEVDTEKFPIAIAKNFALEYPDGGRKVLAPLHIAAQIPFFAPGNAVAFDGRIERYPVESTKSAMKAIRDGRSDWESWLDSQFVGTTDLLLPKDSPLAADALDAGWKPVLESPEWVLLSRPGT